MLRKIEYCKKGYYKSQTSPAEEIESGYFHGFYSVGNNDEGIDVWAIIEGSDGVVQDVSTARVRFFDQPVDDNNNSNKFNNNKSFSNIEESKKLNKTGLGVLEIADDIHNNSISEFDKGYFTTSELMESWSKDLKSLCEIGIENTIKFKPLE